MEAIQGAWTLPGWAHPTCRAIVASDMDTASKYEALTHTLGLANGQAGAAPVTEQRKGLTNETVLGFIPEGRKGIKTDELRQKLAGEGYEERVINLALGRMTKQGKQLVEQNGVLFRAPATAPEQSPASTEQAAEQQPEPLRATG